MKRRWGLALTLLFFAAGCDRPPRTEAARLGLEAFADGAFLPRDPWLDVIELHRRLSAEGGADAWRVPYTRWLEVEDGWDGPERWGAWCVGERTRIRFLLRDPQPYDFFIEALGPPGAEDRPQSVRVLLNGGDVGSFAAGGEWSDHRLRIPEGLLQKGWNRLELVPGYHLDGTLESDHRQLALGFERLGLLRPGYEPAPSGGGPGFRLYRDQEVLVLETSGDYVAPLDVPPTAVSLDVEVAASGSGAKATLAAGLMTIDGEARTLARLSEGGKLALPLAEHRGAQILLTFAADLAPGARFTIRHPTITLGDDKPSGTASAPSADRPPIVLIVLDAARADHFGVYGYERDTTPAIDRLAADALVFENAVAECSYTLCSMPSLLTGLSFVQHGLVEKQMVLRDEVTTLSETLREAGYRTVGFTGNPNNSSVTGTHQGFEEFYEVWKTHPRYITHRVLNRLGKADVREKPLFLMLHYVPPHEPYAPDPDFDVFGDPGYRGPVTSDREFTRDVYAMKVSLDGDDLAEIVSLYDGNLRMADAAVGRVLAALKKAGIYDGALVIVTSDHGEAFLEHGRVGHNSTIYGEMVRVPLIVKLPSVFRERAQGADVKRLVTLADVPATILGLLGLEPPADVRASSLLAPAPAARLIYLRSAQTDTPVLGVRTSRFKALTQAGVPPEIYDVLRDPGEKVNLIVENPVLHAGLSLILARAIRQPGRLRAGVRDGEIADKDKAMLRALGYL